MNNYRLIHRVTPFPDEDVFGFLTRVSERNHVRGLEAILFHLFGKKHLSVLSNHLPRLAEYCRNEAMELLPLCGIEQRQSDGSRLWQINGEWISKSAFISTRKVKVCPDCLRQAPYIRGLWSLSLYTTCAWHDCTLIDSCPACHRLLRWNRRNLTHCSCGFDLRNAAPSLPEEPPSLVARLIAHRANPELRLTSNCLAAREIERLATLSLDGLCKTIWFLV
jgi:hypothetical protein